ncbi:MAG: hypothetical protein J3K34DRAFT_402852 [Monoraphidium minutum]|nr:MAG: hypothetical protein J3K34DRAFT_402852 [Monoraphidium minutum]
MEGGDPFHPLAGTPLAAAPPRRAPRGNARAARARFTPRRAAAGAGAPAPARPVRAQGRASIGTREPVTKLWAARVRDGWTSFEHRNTKRGARRGPRPTPTPPHPFWARPPPPFPAGARRRLFPPASRTLPQPPRWPARAPPAARAPRAGYAQRMPWRPQAPPHGLNPLQAGGGQAGRALCERAASTGSGYQAPTPCMHTTPTNEGRP